MSGGGLQFGLSRATEILRRPLEKARRTFETPSTAGLPIDADELPTGFIYDFSTAAEDVRYPYMVDNVLGETGNWLGVSLSSWNLPAKGLNSLYLADGGIEVTLPAWFPALLFAILPAFWLRRRRIERKRNRIGFCQKCGYDLRATPQRCPECGTAVLAPAPPAPAPGLLS